MANYKVGSFAMNLGAGNQSIVGVGFTPKLVIFISSLHTTTGVTGTLYHMFGAMTADDQFVIMGNSADNQASGNTSTAQYINACIIKTNNGLSTIDTQAAYVSMDSDGFTINISNAPASAYIITYIAIGGNDFNVKIGQGLAPAGAGNQAYTGVGFQPDSILLATVNRTINNAAAEVDTIFGLGAASSKADQGAVCVFSQNGNDPSDTGRKQLTTHCLIGFSFTGTIAYEAMLDSFDADGFTLDFTTPGAGNQIFNYIAMKGIVTKAGAFNSRTAAAEFSIGGVGFRPGLGLFFSYCNPATTSIQTHSELSVGAARTTSERYVHGAVDEDNQATTDADRFYLNNRLYANYDFAQNLEGDIDFVSWDWDGFTLDQTDADTAANEIIFFVWKDVDEPDAPDRIIRTRSIPLSIPSSPNPEGLYNPPQQQTLEEIASLKRRFDNLLTGDPRFLIVGDSEPAQITANQDNYDPGDNTLLWLSSDAARTITGFISGVRGRVLILVNVGAFTITINNDDPGSDAANRVLNEGGGNVGIVLNQWALMVYNVNENRWRLALL